MTDTYMLMLAEIQIPRILKGTKGRVYLTIHDLDGEDVDLDEFDTIILTCKNYPEKDTTITRNCYVSADDDTQCYFDFTEVESAAWLAAPYYAELEFKRYVRDKAVTTSTTGFIPEKSFMNFETCTSDFVVGELITGAISGHTAVVYAYENYGGIGELELIKPTGVFQDGEEITSPGGGSAYVVIGINDTEYIDDRFADASKDFVALGVAAKDEITISSSVYVIDGYDTAAIDWLTTETDNSSPGTGITYTINTIDVSTSATDDLLKTLPFTLYIEEPLA